MTQTPRHGIALPLALLVLVVLGLLATTMLALSVHRTHMARARLVAVRARHAAEAGARTALATWRTADVAPLAAGEAAPGPAVEGALSRDARYEAFVRRLDRRTFLVHAIGLIRIAREEAVARAGLLVRTVDPARLVDGFDAGLVLGGGAEIRDGATIDGEHADTVPPSWSAAACDSVYGESDGVLGAARPAVLASDTADVRVSPGARVAGQPPIATDRTGTDSAAFADLGPLGADLLASIADRRPTGTVDLAPRSPEGRCDGTTAPDRWGDPEHPAGPCGDDFPLIVADGDLEVADGAGQGVLVVRGDLVLRSGVRFYGPVLVGGSLVVEADAHVYGAVRAAALSDPAAVSGDIVYSACAVGRALRLSPALDRPFRPSGRWWVPLF